MPKIIDSFKQTISITKDIHHVPYLCLDFPQDSGKDEEVVKISVQVYVFHSSFQAGP